MSGIFGSSPKASSSKPYQGPQFGQQQDMLSNYFLNAFQQQNGGPSYAGQGGQDLGLGGSYSMGSTQSQAGGIPFNYGNRGLNFNQMMVQDNVAKQNNSMGAGMTRPSQPYSQPQGFQQAGQAINGQMTYSPFQFTDTNPTFAARNPYQFTLPDKINVGDTYTPQMALANREIMQQDARSREQQLADMNRRGLLTTGATTKVLDLQKQQTDRKLADLASQYSIEQAKSQLAVDQQRQQMEQQRQINQAAELFQQSGATDAQAQFLANQNFNRQNAQASQNLAGYGANLQGRQQGLAEEQYANLMRRQPLEDLYRMWAQQTGQVSQGGTPGSSGIMGALGTIGGTALAGLI